MPKNICAILFLLSCLISSASASQGRLCAALQGTSVVATDGTYLGLVASSYHGESIFNEFGTYGSEFSSQSIWNEFGPYGGEFAAMSPFNEFTSSPPLIIKDGQPVARLTVNAYMNGGVNPWALRACGY